MRKLAFLLLLLLPALLVFSNDQQLIKNMDTLLLKKLVDSLNMQIQKKGTYREIVRVSENGAVNIQYLNLEQKFNFNLFALGNDTTSNAYKESKFGIAAEFCDPRTHAPRSTINFTTADGNIKAFIFFKCLKDEELKLIHQLILKIRSSCTELKDYLK